MNRPKEKLGKLIREIGEVFSVENAANVLGSSRIDAAKVLARWAAQGWLTRIRRGLYSTVPIEAAFTNQALEDSWSIIPELFTPCYIGGWSAAEYWNLTEQIFNSICVMSAQAHAKKLQEIHNISFSLTKINPNLMFGTKIIWRKNKKF